MHLKYLMASQLSVCCLHESFFCQFFRKQYEGLNNLWNGWFWMLVLSPFKCYKHGGSRVTFLNSKTWCCRGRHTYRHAHAISSCCLVPTVSAAEKSSFLCCTHCEPEQSFCQVAPESHCVKSWFSLYFRGSWRLQATAPPSCVRWLDFTTHTAAFPASLFTTLNTTLPPLVHRGRTVCHFRCLPPRSSSLYVHEE